MEAEWKAGRGPNWREKGTGIGSHVGLGQEEFNVFFRRAVRVHMKLKVECYLLPHINVFPVQTIRYGGTT